MHVTVSEKETIHSKEHKEEYTEGFKVKKWTGETMKLYYNLKNKI